MEVRTRGEIRLLSVVVAVEEPAARPAPALYFPPARWSAEPRARSTFDQRSLFGARGDWRDWLTGSRRAGQSKGERRAGYMRFTWRGAVKKGAREKRPVGRRGAGREGTTTRERPARMEVGGRGLVETDDEGNGRPLRGRRRPCRGRARARGRRPCPRRPRRTGRPSWSSTRRRTRLQQRRPMWPT